MKERLTIETIRKCDEAKQVADDLKSEIVDRIDYILCTIYEAFGKKLDNWYFDGAAEGEVGDPDFDSVDLEGDISGFVLSPRLEQSIILDKDGGEVDFRQGFPARWLIEDFEDELNKGKAAYEKKLTSKAALKQTKKAKKAELLNGIKAKLTKEELKLLKL